MTTQITAANTNPVVTNVTFNISGTTVTVHYDVDDAEESSVTISMEVSSDNGVNWNFNYGAASGDIGAGIATGTNKTIIWTYEAAYNDQFKIKIIADDLVGDQIYYSGKIYNTVTIVSQVWLKENLDVGVFVASPYNGGTTQSYVTDNGIIEKYCYSNDTANCNTYGGLYDWNEAMQYLTTPGTKGICPTGWHIPTRTEFQTLALAVSSDGNALKAVGQGTAPDGIGTNTSGFSALLAGIRAYYTIWSSLTLGTSIWSSTQYDATSAYEMGLQYFINTIYKSYNYKESGYSIRCLKD